MNPAVFRPSTVALLMANMVPLFGALFWGWKTYDILVVFWLENVVIGVLNVARMVSTLILSRRFALIPMIPFFCFHYGMFTMGHGFFIKLMFGPGSENGFEPAPDHNLFDVPLPEGEQFLALIALLFSHTVSFVVNFIGKGEYKKATEKTLMTSPYARIIVLHIAILFGGFAVEATGETIFALVLLVVLKIAIDLFAHLREHKDDKTPQPTA